MRLTVEGSTLWYVWVSQMCSVTTQIRTYDTALTNPGLNHFATTFSKEKTQKKKKRNNGGDCKTQDYRGGNQIKL